MAQCERYTVTCTAVCTTCNGARVVSNLTWQRFFADTKTDKEPDADAWARAHGFENAAAMGREEECCPDCEGQGIFQYAVPLQDALKALGVTLPDCTTTPAAASRVAELNPL